MTLVDIDVLCSSVTSSWQTSEKGETSINASTLSVADSLLQSLSLFIFSLPSSFFFIFLKRPSLFLLHVISKKQAKRIDIALIRMA